MRDLNEGLKSMKVTVCFGRVRVVVPCADGSLTVGELQEKAISRFHKATGRPLSQWIRVRTLITSPDGAILDPNDRLKDVVDDRDQIIAIFEDHNGSLVQQRGDGTSGSSVSASSPEMFHDDHVNENDDVMQNNNNPKINDTDVIITSKDLMTGSKLSVRRGSEPALNFKESEARVSCKVRHNGNRSQHSQSPDDLQELDSDSGVSGSDTADRKKKKQSQNLEAKDAQLRDFAYKKMIEAVNSDRSVCDVQDQKDHSLKRPPTSNKLPDKEGGFAGRNGVAFRYSSIEDLDSSCFGEAGGTAPPIPPRKTPPLALQKTIASGRTNTRLLGKQIFLQLVKGPHGLGFTVTTRDNPAGGNCPIYVKNIKPQGAAIESGLLQPGDRLLQVNDIEVTGKSQSKVVSILRGVPEGSTVDLVISRQELLLLETSLELQQQQTVCKGDFQSVPTLGSRATGSELASAAVEEGGSGAEDVDILVFDICLNSNSAVQGLGVKLKGKTSSTPKEPKDLGLFIKAVIADGAVAKDGRLQPDDQLLEVNGERLLDQTNTEATRLLRFALQKESIPSGFAKVIVARRKDGSSDTQVKNDHAAAEKAEEQGQKTSLRKERTTSQELQMQNGRLKVSGSHRLHNLSYQQAVDSAVQSAMSNGGCAVSKNSPTSMALNGDHDHPDRTCAGTKRSQVAHSAGNPESDKTGSIEQLNLDCKNLEITQETSSSDSETKSQAFQREGFGRQSMSEKRKGHLDPRTTEVYQKIRQNKGRFCSASLDRHRTKSKPFEDVSTSTEETRPVAALKKSTSLESLKAAHQDPDPATEPSKGPVDSQGRLCGTNNSFRAAVDRSYVDRSYEKNRVTYEAQLNEAETNISSDKVSHLNDRSTGSKDLVESQGSKKDKGRGPFKVIGGILRFGRRKKDGLKADESHSRIVDGGRDEVKGNGVKPSQPNEKRNPSDVEEQTWSDHLIVSRSLSEPKSILMNPITKPDDPAKMKKNGLVSSRSAADHTDHLLPTSAVSSRGAIRMDISPPLDLSNRCCSPTSQERVSAESPSMNRLMQLRQEHQRHHQERQHRYPLDAQEEEYELRLRELEQQHTMLLERENQCGSSSIQYRSRVDMPPGSRNPYLERPMSCGSHYQNIDIVRSQLQLHDEYQLRYQAQLRYQQQILHQQQQQQLLQQLQQRQHPVTIATQPPVHHRYSKSYSAQPLGVYPRSVSPAVFCNNQTTQEVLQNCEAITMALPEYKHIPGPLQNQKVAIPTVLQNRNIVPGPFQNCDDNRVGLQNFERNSRALGNNGNFYENRSYKWNQVRDPSEHRFPSGGETDQRPVLSHRRYYSGFASHSRLPPAFRGNVPSAWRANDVEHYYSSGGHTGGQRQNQRDQYKY